MPRKAAALSVAQRQEQATLAIARLDTAAQRSPVRAGCLQRSRITAAQRLAAAEGDEADPDRLLAAILGLPIAARADGGAAARALSWLRLWLEADTPAALAEAPARDWTGRIGPASVEATAPAFEGVRAGLACLLSYGQARRTGVVAALPGGVAAAIAEGVPRAAALAAIPYALNAAGLVGAVWPALAPAPDGEPGDGLWPGRLFEAVADQATRALAELDRLEASWRDWHTALGERRGHSRLPQLLHLAASLPGLSSVFVARRLGTPERPCTVPGASFLLRDLVRRGVLVEATARRSWRLYVPADLASLRQLRYRAGGSLQGADAPEPADLLADDRPPVALKGLAVTRLERPAVSSAVEADWALLLADIDRATERASGYLARTKLTGAPA